MHIANSATQIIYNIFKATKCQKKGKNKSQFAWDLEYVTLMRDKISPFESMNS
jgi:hypothetical protein